MSNARVTHSYSVPSISRATNIHQSSTIHNCTNHLVFDAGTASLVRLINDRLSRVVCSTLHSRGQLGRAVTSLLVPGNPV